MKTTHTLVALMIATTTLVTGCASNGPQAPTYSASQPESSTYGTIDTIQVTRMTPQTSGAGAVAGGLVGALLGNQIGSGGGRTAATAAGAIGGAVVGNNIESNRDQAQARDAYQISVRLDNGDYRTVVQDSVYDLHVGNRVRLIDGRIYRD
ncbi:MAG TPA: glycine zipper 2TM domain-containing protein [Janthinobacterium sp.]|jgi:outer membrane lipoprotein SlyB|nr:glycine zipper 2TM domain-containing protein [Janthinobacterium sp.]